MVNCDEIDFAKYLRVYEGTYNRAALCAHATFNTVERFNYLRKLYTRYTHSAIYCGKMGHDNIRIKYISCDIIEYTNLRST